MNPFDFQLEGVRRIERFGGRVLLADAMGLGKTLQALLWLKSRPDALPAVVVCPAGVKYYWQHEAAAGVGIAAGILEGRRPSRNGTDRKIVIINYDILTDWVDRLRAINPRTVVLDECQYVSNAKTLRTKAARLLCRGVPHVLALSGTPLLNRPIELFPTLQILRPKVFQSRWNFAHAFCNPKLTPWGWDFKGASNTQKLNELLVANVMIRRRKIDVLKGLPPKVRQVVPVPIKNPDEYRRAADDFVGWLRRHDPAKAERASRAAAMVRMGYLLRLSARLKLRYVVGWINRFLANGDEKLVVFAVHRKMIEALKRRCNAESVVIVGGIKGKKRKMLVDQFQGDDKVRLLIGNIRAAGVGITLTAANTAVFAELAWQPGALVQAEDRIHRIGTKGTAFVWYLVAHGTIEEQLCELLQRKQRVLSTVLDGGSVNGDLDVFDSLLKEMKKEN